MSRSSTIVLHGGLARITRPTSKTAYYKVSVTNSVTGRRSQTSGGRTEETARAAADLLMKKVNPTLTETCPSLNEAFDDWIDSNAHRWSPRTVDNYRYIYKVTLGSIGDNSIDRITVDQIKRSVRASDLSKQQLQRCRTIIRGVFSHAKRWITLPAENYAQAVTIKGYKSRTDSRMVDHRQIPSNAYVFNLCNVLYRTINDDGYIGKLPRDVVVEPHGADIFFRGLPSSITDTHRRGIPNHYKNLKQHRENEDSELKDFYLRLTGIVVLGAAGGLRIGECLALRAKHLLTVSQVRNLLMDQEDAIYMRLQATWDGRIRIEEQVSQASSGKNWISLPKSNRVRESHIVPFLPAYMYEPIKVRMDQSQSMLSREDTDEIYKSQYAFPAKLVIIEILMLILKEWRRRSASYSESELIRNVLDSMLFPTRSPARRNKDGLTIYKPDEWTGTTSPDPLTKGNYMTTSNLAGKFMNEAYDYVSSIMHEYPPSVESNKRQGYTHHSLRHWAISTRLKNGMYLPELSAMMGHSNPSFTLERYSHLLNISDADKPDHYNFHY